MQTKKDIILLNLANIDLINFCKENKIDCSDTYIYKYPRHYTYALLRGGDHRAIVTTSFSKNSVPVHTIHD